MTEYREEDLVTICEEYLGSLHSTLWGSFYDVIDPKRRREGAEWLAKQIHNVAQFAETETEVDVWQSDRYGNVQPAVNGTSPRST